MIILKKTHHIELDRQKQLYEARINDLKAQIEDLRKLVFSPTSALNTPAVMIEADAVISGKEEIYQLSEKEQRELEEAIHERDRLLSGNY